MYSLKTAALSVPYSTAVHYSNVNTCKILIIFLTGISGSDIYVFDPYYEEPDDPELDKEFFEEGITFITDQPKRANRLISITRLSGTGVGFYEMGPYEEREAVILFNTNTRKTPENSIEYII